MSFLRTGISAFGKLIALGVLLVVFFAGMTGVVLMSLQGTEIKVPEITGKNFTESEHELALLGLKIKKRADRVSQEAPNTVIEQLPKPGETVKTGQMILVVTSKAPGDGDELPALKKTDEDDASKIEEMISDKPKKPKSNSNSNSNKKKADTTRDVIGDNSNSNSNTDSLESNSNKKETGTNSAVPGANKSGITPGGKPAASGTPKPADRPRVSNRP